MHIFSKIRRKQCASIVYVCTPVYVFPCVPFYPHYASPGHTFHSGAVNSLDVRAEGAVGVAGSADHTGTVFSLQTGKVCLVTLSDVIPCLAKGGPDSGRVKKTGGGTYGLLLDIQKGVPACKTGSACGTAAAFRLSLCPARSVSNPVCVRPCNLCRCDW